MRRLKKGIKGLLAKRAEEEMRAQQDYLEKYEDIKRPDIPLPNWIIKK